MFLVPLVVGFIGLLLISAHPRSYHFDYLDAPHTEDDPLRHAAIGCLVAILQDFSNGRVAEPHVYSSDLLYMMEAEFHAMQVYRDRGFQFHFAFHHEETYDMHIRHVLSKTEFVVEIDGLFDYYFERDGQLHGTPQVEQQVDPLIRVPGYIRLRLRYDHKTKETQLLGWSENIRGLQVGLATQ